MKLNKLQSVAFVTPNSSKNTKNDLFKQEKQILKEEFAALGNQIEWDAPDVQKKLKALARQVITVTTDVVNQTDLIGGLLPTETIEPGDTYTKHELSGPNVYFGTYGASVRMSRPQFTPYSATPQLKEVGIKLDLAKVQRGKYSASELGNYTAGLITAWKNRLLFTTTLAGMSAYQSGGAQYKAGTSLGVSTLLSTIDLITDEAELKVIVARRNAIHQLANQSAWSNETKREFEVSGQIGTYGGMPVVKVNSFTDNDYGVVYPFPKDELWMFSELPAGVYVSAGALRTSSETILQNESLNIYMRWDDGIGIFHSDRIARCAVIT